ncbi:MAG: hypothetical protein AAF125_21725 [Chloroflexota bacterium]
MTNMLYYAHSGTRWLLVAATLFALGFMIFSLVTKRDQDRVTRISMLTFSSLIGVQWIVGIVYYLAYGAQIDDYTLPWQVNHASIMTGALVVAHLYLPFRRRAGNQTYYIASIVVIVLVIAIVLWGVGILPGGVARWSFAPNFPPPPPA